MVHRPRSLGRPTRRTATLLATTGSRVQGEIGAVQPDGARRARRRRPHHGDADLAARPRRPGDPGPHRAAAVPGRQRAAPDGRPRRAAARPRRRVRPPGRQAPVGRVPRRRGGRDHGPQELRRHRQLPRRGPPAGARPARASPASSCSTRSTTGGCATGSTAATSSWPSAPPGRTTAGWSSSAPSTAACCRAATCRSSTSTGAATLADEAIGMGAAALLVASGCPPDALAQPRRARRRVGPGRGGRHPRRVPRRRHRRPDRPALLRQRPAGPARLPRRRGELPLGRLHGHPRARRPRRWRR